MFELVQWLVRTIRGEISTKKLVKMGLIVGENFNRQGKCIIDPPHCWLIKIGNDVTLATGVYILAHDASIKSKTGYAKITRTVIGDNVFVGAYSIIMPGVKIGNNVVIGSGSVVTKNVPDNSVVAGNPARIISTYDDYISKHMKQMKKSSVFDERYTVRSNISNEKKEEMIKKIGNGIGYVK